MEAKMLKKMMLVLLLGFIALSGVAFARTLNAVSDPIEINVTPTNVSVTTTNVLTSSNSFAQTFKVTETGLLKSITISSIKTSVNNGATITIYVFDLTDPDNITSYSSSDTKYITKSASVSISKNKTQADVEFTFSTPSLFVKNHTYLFVVRDASNSFGVKASTNNTYYNGMLFTQSEEHGWNSSSDKDLVFSSLATVRFEVSFDVDGGSPKPASQYVLYGGKATKPTDPTKTGYVFCGWTDGEDSWNFAVDTVDEKGVELVACWNAVDYTVTYHLDGGDNDSSNPLSYTIEDAYTLLPAQKVGYDFDGWYTSAEGGSEVTGIAEGTTGNLDFYARYTAITYSITYQLHGGSNDADNPFEYTIESNSISFNDASRTGYTFDGWFTEETGGTQVTGVPQGSHGDVEVHAHWIKNQYKVDFESYDGSSVSSQLVYYKDSSVEPTDPTLNGYDFKGWYEDEDFATKWDFTNEVTEDITLYAKWVPTEYTIEYVLDNGTNDADNKTSYTIESDDIDLLNPTRDGYTFTGWFTASTGGSEIAVIESGSTGDVTVYARWIANTDTPYTVLHYRQNKLGDYVLYLTETLGGETDATISGTPQTWLGFTYNPDHADAVVEGVVTADGALVLSLYYDREKQIVEYVPKEDTTKSEVDGLDGGIDLPELDDEDVYKVKVELIVEPVTNEGVLNMISETTKNEGYNLLKVLDLSLLKTTTYSDGSEVIDNVSNSQIKQNLTITFKLADEYIGVSNLKVAYVSNDGTTVEFLDTTVFQNTETGVWYVSFQTNHFSNYALIKPAGNLPDTGVAGNAGMLFLGLSGIFMILSKKSKKQN